MSKRLRKLLLLTVKIAIAIALLGWVFSSVHWHDYVEAKADGKSYAVLEAYPSADAPRELLISDGKFWGGSQWREPVENFEPLSESGEVVRKGFASSISGLKVWLLVCAAGGFLVSMLIVTVRWWFMLRIQRIRIGLWESARLTFLGLFFNAVVPGTVGGDLVKAYYVSKHTPRKAAALVSTFVDRMMGLTELTLLAAVMIVVVWAAGLETFEKIRLPAISIVVVIFVVALVLTFLLSKRFRRLLHLQKLYQRLPIAKHIAAAGHAANLYRRRLRYLAQAVLMTFGAHVFWVGAVAFIGASLGLQIPWYSYFVYIPLIYILGAVPLTPGGVGLIEKFYVVFFVAAAVGASEVLALALLARLLPMFWGLPGAVVAVTGPRLPKAEAIKAELGLNAVEKT